MPRAQSKIGQKRKAGEISDIENEVRAWATSPGNVALEGQPKLQTQQQATTIEGRPMKKLKTLMNRAAYVAVGGAALFFGLVATAPDFA